MVKNEEVKILEEGMKNKENKKLKQIAFIVYDESAPSNWREELSKIPCYIILHDKDINPDGSPKKPHYHVLICMDNPISKNTMEGIVKKIGASNGIYQKVSSFRSYARYLCHLDNMDKYRYDTNLVINCGGIMEYEEVIESKADNVNTAKQIINYCRINKINSYARLIDVCISEYPNWFKLLCYSGYGSLIKSYIKSDYWTRHNNI